jgi:hypothetical protein
VFGAAVDRHGDGGPAGAVAWAARVARA